MFHLTHWKDENDCSIRADDGSDGDVAAECHSDVDGDSDDCNDDADGDDGDDGYDDDGVDVVKDDSDDDADGGGDDDWW